MNNGENMTENKKDTNKFKFFFSRKRIIWIVLFVIAVVMLIVSSVKIYKTYHLPKNELSVYHDKTASEAKPDEEEEPQTKNPIDFAALQKRNPDVCGWIYVPGTDEVYGSAIDYPILQSGTEKEEDFYLNHDIDGKPLFDGCVYIQRLNSKDFSDSATVIYGHDLRNNSMFSPLRRYRKKEFFDKHQYIYIYTPENIMKYKIFSSALYSDKHILYSYDFFSKPEQFMDFIGEITDTSRSAMLVRNGIEIMPEDKIITLSTCTNKEHERLLVSAVLQENIKLQ